MNIGNWIGVGTVVIAGGAFLYKISQVMRGSATGRALITEFFHGAGLVCLVVALIIGKESAVYIYLLAGFAVAFAVYLARAISSRKKARSA